MFTVQTGVLTLKVDRTIYSRDCLLRTAYWYTDRCYIFICGPIEDHFVVHLKAKAATLEQPSPEPLESVAGEFCNSLLDFQLRDDIEARTGTIRELIVTKALSASGLLGDPPPGGIEDPVGTSQGLVQIGTKDA